MKDVELLIGTTQSVGVPDKGIENTGVRDMKKLQRPNRIRKGNRKTKSERLFESLEQRVDLGESEQPDPRIDEFRQTLRQMSQMKPFGNLVNLFRDQDGHEESQSS